MKLLVDGLGTTTVFRYIREAIDALAALAPTLAEAIEIAVRKAFVILDGTLLRIDRVGMTGGRDRPFYSGKWKCHGVNVQVIADPTGRLIWVSPALPGARHDMGAAGEHGIITALAGAGVQVVVDTSPHPGRLTPSGKAHRALSTWDVSQREPAPAPR